MRFLFNQISLLLFKFYLKTDLVSLTTGEFLTICSVCALSMDRIQDLGQAHKAVKEVWCECLLYT